MSKFSKSWEPTLELEEVVASGEWYYQNEIRYELELVRQVWDYTSYDLMELYDLAIDYVSFAVSDEGVLYFWKFTCNGNTNYSGSFSTYFQARDHLDTYGYKHNITW